MGPVRDTPRNKGEAVVAGDGALDVSCQELPLRAPLLALLLVARATLGQEPSPPPTAPASDVTARPSEPSHGRTPIEHARATDLGFVLELRSDFGFEQLVDVEYTTDRRNQLNLNDGLAIELGASFLPLAGNRLATRVAAGFKIDMLRASNGNALFTAVPLDVVETAYVGPLRLGAGASVLLWPRIRGDGFLGDAGFRFDPAPGAVLEAEWIVAPRSRTGIGLRASWYRFSWNGVTRGAPAIGLVLRADVPVG